LAEEEGASLQDIAAMFVVAERLFGLPAIWQEIETAPISEGARLALLDEVAVATRSQIADLLRAAKPGEGLGDMLARLQPGITALDSQAHTLLKAEARAQSSRIAAELEAAGAPPELA